MKTTNLVEGRGHAASRGGARTPAPARFSPETLQRVADILADNLLAERQRERGHD